MPPQLLFAGAAALVLAAALWWPVRAYVRAVPESTARRGPLFAAAIGALAIVSLYGMLGSPGLSGGAHAERMAALRERDPESYSPEESVAVLSEVAREHPRDARPMVYIGRLEAALGRPARALAAFEEALRRDPENAEAMIDMGRVMVAMGEGVVSAEARALFEQAAARDADNPVPYLYQAMAAQQEGRAEDARRLWLETQSRLAADDPRREMVRRMLEGEGAP
ncbi:MAG: tetratricopeptide repeat protein [Hyphomonadaceae bacterium]